MKQYVVFVDTDRHELSVEEIFALRHEPLTIVCKDNAGNDINYSYADFSKLSNVRKEILALDLALSQSGGNTPSTADTLVGDLRHPLDNICKPNKDIASCTMDLLTFLKLAGSLIPRFSDDANELEYFVDQVLQLESATPDNLKPNLVTFVKGRLLGKARNSAVDCNSITEIIDALRKDIVLESSIILESRLAALRFDDKNLTDFASAVEKVADQLINSLIFEGVTKAKATQMATRLVVDNCRKSARSPTIKTILAACTFSSPREVLTKFRAEVADLKKEHQFLTYNTHTGNRRGGSNSSPRNYNNYNNHSNYSQPNSYQYQGNNNGHYNNHNNNNSRNNNSNWRGRRGNFHGNNYRPQVRVMQEEPVQQNNHEQSEASESGNEEAVRWPTNSL